MKENHEVERISLNRLAARATTHCMTGCAIGEVLGLVIASAAGWGNAASIALAIALAFFFGYSFNMAAPRGGARVCPGERPRPGRGYGFDHGHGDRRHAIMLVIPGAMEAGLGSALCWGSLALSLAIAWVAAFPLNRWLIARGRGQAVVHDHHPHHDHHH